MATLSKHGRSRLPQPLTPLIGREDETASITALLGSGEIRLLTLTGPGGIGKTRLALSAAEQLHGTFSGDVWFVSLAPIADHNLVVPTIAGALEVAEHATQSILDRLTGYLMERHTLLVLDNVEHVIEATPGFAHLLEACPALHLLITSREPLHLEGEHQYPVPPLSLPATHDRQSGTSLLESDAIRLFMDRARQASPTFGLTEANATAIGEICRRMDGLPLAIELAAAWMKVLSPEDLLTRLDRPMAILTGGPRNAPARQQTMHDTLQWSYLLLTPDEQRLFRHLSIFAGGCTLDAIEAVTARDDFLETLSSLVDKSLIQRGDHPGQIARFSMLEPVRQFALERLMEDDDDTSRVRQQHARYFLSVVEGLSDRLDGPEGPAWFDRIESELDNLRGALYWLHDTSQFDLGLQLVSELGQFWAYRDYFSEGRAHAEAFLNLPGASQPTIERARALWSTSWLWVNRDEFNVALHMNREAQAIAEKHDDRFVLANSIHVQGMCHLRLGDGERARTDFECALLLFRELQNTRMVGRVLAHLGILVSHQGDLDRARAHLEEALSLTRANDLKVVTALALGGLGWAAEQSGEADRAVNLQQERLILYRDLGILWGTAASIERIACLAHRQWPNDAVCLFGSASAVLERISVSAQSTFNPDIDETLDALRSTMPDADFQVAWDRGRNMALENAINLALRPFGIDRNGFVSAVSSGLTPREAEVLELIARRLSNQTIADRLFISPRTVERHIENLYRKLDIHCRSDAVDVGRRLFQ
jgi:predicted ATPase/DNA-binding CsgD family transcriptional regulator